MVVLRSWFGCTTSFRKLHEPCYISICNGFAMVFSYRFIAFHYRLQQVTQEVVVRIVPLRFYFDRAKISRNAVHSMLAFIIQSLFYCGYLTFLTFSFIMQELPCRWRYRNRSTLICFWSEIAKYYCSMWHIFQPIIGKITRIYYMTKAE